MYVPASELCLLCVNTIDYNKWKPANEVTLFVDWLYDWTQTIKFQGSNMESSFYNTSYKLKPVSAHTKWSGPSPILHNSFPIPL